MYTVNKHYVSLKELAETGAVHTIDKFILKKSAEKEANKIASMHYACNADLGFATVKCSDGVSRNVYLYRPLTGDHYVLNDMKDVAFYVTVNRC